MMGVEVIKQGHLYRIRSRTAPNLLLELKDGSKSDGTQAQGWNDVNDWEAYFNQIWLVNKDTTAGKDAWTLQNIRAGTYLDLDSGGTAPGTKIQGCGPSSATQCKPSQVWLFESAGVHGGWRIVHSQAALAVDLTNGGKGNGNPIAGWTSQPGNDNQIWDFEEYSYTADELEGHIKSMPIKSGTNIASYTSPPDKKYLILPAELYQKIWSDAKIGDYQVRPAVFDYDALTLAYKVAVTKYGNDFIDQNVAKVTLLAGTAYGARGDNSHAFNWSLGPVNSPTLLNASGRLLKYFDPQPGKWLESCDYQLYFILF